MDHVHHHSIDSCFECPQVPSDLTDLTNWDKIWETLVSEVSTTDAYSLLKNTLLVDRPYTTPIPQVRQILHTVQKAIVAFQLQECRDIVANAWVALERGERKRHILYGLRESCKSSQHLRMLGPEITSTAMLKKRGMAYIDFIMAYSAAIKAAGSGNVYILPNASWDSVVDVPKPWPEEDSFAFTHLTLQRNLMIAQFVMHSFFSIQKDLITLDTPLNSTFSNYMDRLKDRIQSFVACQNCNKTPEKIGVNTKFLVCSVCKTKLGSAVYYCSQACQKKDWPNHKQNCGKKVSRKNYSALSDSPNQNWTSILEQAKRDEGDDITSIGFGTEHPSHPHSPALKRQVALLRADPGADYFLFDKNDNPIRVVLGDMMVRIAFRFHRAEAMFNGRPQCVGMLAAHLITVMGTTPGLSRDLIVSQFCREFGDVTTMLEMAEHMHKPGKTALEDISDTMSAVATRH